MSEMFISVTWLHQRCLEHERQQKISGTGVYGKEKRQTYVCLLIN